jgi:hypothetical protein
LDRSIFSLLLYRPCTTLSCLGFRLDMLAGADLLRCRRELRSTSSAGRLDGMHRRCGCKGTEDAKALCAFAEKRAGLSAEGVRRGMICRDEGGWVQPLFQAARCRAPKRHLFALFPLGRHCPLGRHGLCSPRAHPAHPCGP